LQFREIFKRNLLHTRQSNFLFPDNPAGTSDSTFTVWMSALACYRQLTLRFKSNTRATRQMFQRLTFGVL
jgi:hypothetical protein